jgi:tRNA threonylcarbamoyladenosine biosynthesis protein TsaE
VLELVARSLADTHAVAGALAALVRSGDVILLAGEMGAGKTAFTKAVAAALDVTEPVTSPTFTLVHSYDTGRMPVHHADLYRLGTLHEVADLGLPELVESRGVLLVEWGDVASTVFGDHLEITLVAGDEDESVRTITIRAVGGAWATRWGALTESLAAWSTSC